MNRSPLPAAYDPYDLWATSAGVAARRGFYAGSAPGKAGALALGLADWLLPGLSRRLMGARPRVYAVTASHLVLARAVGTEMRGEEWRSFAPIALETLSALAVRGGLPAGAVGWGHGFPWMSKNGLYPPDTPLVTLTPYAMEALLALSREEACRAEATALFRATWGFLESLRVMSDDGDGLALSYAPREEPRIVTNANTYAAFAYALHAVHGDPGLRDVARDKAARLLRRVTRQISADGSWRYYADDLPGNFIDGFHSCFVLKNLRKTAALLPAVLPEVRVPLARGWAFLRERFLDREAGLCRRFVARDIRDPFRWDLYDQAEYLGQLIDFREMDQARKFREVVERRFRRGNAWYCRIDILGRPWGKNFLRWGPAPFAHQSARLDAALAGREEIP